jgi:hypothetical protein
MRLLLTVVFLFTLVANGQSIRPDIAVKQPAKGRLVPYFPYSSLQVIDNRLDTTKIYTEETGIYPPHNVAFTEPAAVVIKKYMDASVSASRRGHTELLINLEQLGITNMVHNLKRFSRSGVIASNQVRAFLQFQVTAWYKNEQGNYNKLLTIKREYNYNGYEYIGRAVRRLLDDCIRLVTFAAPDSAIDPAPLASKLKDWLADPESVQFEKGQHNNIPFEQINVNRRNRWAAYPAFEKSPSASGVYYLFDDFRNNRITQATVQMKFSEKDSLYHVVIPANDTLIHKKPHWGLYDGVNWFINLSDSAYLKLVKGRDAFSFYVPASMPDMYALLSIQENYTGPFASSTVATGNILSTMVATLINSALQQSIADSENKSLINRFSREGLQHNYRYCTLDMDNGDIIYHEK